MPVKTRLHQLADHSQSVWIDFLSRDLLRGGELARMMREDAVSGVTSNPTIFAKALRLPVPTCSLQPDQLAML
jgi:transaldolase